ncbi:hypothetical protein MN608_00177 [Microdochium nivale]|nr:hypothetical protein MN608_00177 [Microdochium nivale]
MHAITPFLALVWLAKAVAMPTPTLGYIGTEPSDSLEENSTSKTTVIMTTMVTVSLPQSLSEPSALSSSIPPAATTSSQGTVISAAAADVDAQQEQLASLPSSPAHPTSPATFENTITASIAASAAAETQLAPQQTPPSSTRAESRAQTSTRRPFILKSETALAVAATAAAAQPPSEAAPSPLQPAPPMVTPAPQVPSFEEAYGGVYTQTTFWSCNARAQTTQCGWHEPIIYVGGNSAGRTSYNLHRLFVGISAVLLLIL